MFKNNCIIFFKSLYPSYQDEDIEKVDLSMILSSSGKKLTKENADRFGFCISTSDNEKHYIIVETRENESIIYREADKLEAKFLKDEGYKEEAAIPADFK